LKNIEEILENPMSLKFVKPSMMRTRRGSGKKKLFDESELFEMIGG
jgi:hypothetical protein